MSPPNSSRICSVTSATFMVQLKRSPWLAEAGDFAFRVDHRLPVSLALIMLSPLLALTRAIFGQHNEKIFSAARI
jgi:hypothetical protein